MSHSFFNTGATLADLRARMREIGECIRLDIPHSAEEAAAYHAWRRTVRQQRASDARGREVRDALAEPVGGMHAGDPAGMRFVPPVVRGTGPTKRWAAR